MGEERKNLGQKEWNQEEWNQEEAGQENFEQDSFENVYLEELAAIEPCSEEETRQLIAKIRNGDAKARERLIEGNLKKALFFVQDYINQGVPLSDLIQEASMELMLLADEGFEGSFETLLESRIRVRLEEVVKEQKSEADIEEEMLARVNVLQEVSKTMAEQLGREATLAELAERMKMTEDEVREIMKVTMDALSMSEINRSLQS